MSCHLEKRFMPAAAVRWEQLNPAVQACIRAEMYCTGYIFHPGRTSDLGGALARAAGSASSYLLVAPARVYAPGTHRQQRAVLSGLLGFRAPRGYIPCP
jgi:hypothetical protein